MTNYRLTPIVPRSIAAKAKKAARKKLLEEVRTRRAQNYKRFLQEQKRRLQVADDLV